MGAIFQPFADDDGHGGVGATGDDMGAFVNIPRVAHRRDFETVLGADFLGVGLAIRLGWTVDLNLFNLARLQKRLDMGARHAAGADHANDAGVFPRHILGADAGVGADPHMLQIAVIDQRQRLAVLDAVQENQAAKIPRPHAVLFLGDGALILLLVDHVRFHANGEVARHGAAFHGAPLINFLRIASRNLHIDARPADRLLARQFPISLVQRVHGQFHGQHLFDIVVVEKKHLAPPRTELFVYGLSLSPRSVHELTLVYRI